MITALFLGVVAFFVYRLFINAEEWYAQKSTDFKGWITQPGLWLKLLVPLSIALALWFFFSKKIKLK